MPRRTPCNLVNPKKLEWQQRQQRLRKASDRLDQLDYIIEAARERQHQSRRGSHAHRHATDQLLAAYAERQTLLDSLEERRSFPSGRRRGRVTAIYS